MIQPKISIIIPIYNLENYIPKCIESVINQSYKKLEIIIINDGSTDRSGAICNYYAQQDNRIVIIHQDNRGLSVTRNRGLDIATGDYIGFLDGDDWLELDMFEYLYNQMHAYGADISMCNTNYVDEKGQIILNENGDPYFDRYYLNTNSVYILEKSEKISNLIYSDNNYIWNKLYKKSLFGDIRFPEHKIYEDIFVTYRLIDKAEKIVVSPESKYNYLQRNNSISNCSFKPGQLNMVEAYIERHKYIKTKYPDLEAFCRKCIFVSLLSCIYRAYSENSFNLYKKELNNIISIVKTYDINKCGLSEQDEKISKALFNNIKKYVSSIKKHYIIYKAI